MRNAVIIVLSILLIVGSFKTAAAFTVTFPKSGDAIKDSKPAKLLPLDQVWLSAEPVAINSMTKVNVLVNRVTKKVEYVWSYKYNRYVRPKFSIPDIQKLYDLANSKGK